jgi:hypothetical protein
MESLILREPWRDLFSKEELDKAITRLKDLKYPFEHGEIV